MSEVADTLAPWLYHRFNKVATPWSELSDEDRSYWEHEAAAVRRAVARNGFREPVTVPAAPLVAVDADATGTTLTFTPSEAGEVW